MNAKTTVHIVDDDEPVRAGLQRLFISVGMNARTYDSARQFLDTFVDDPPGCVLLDLQMPEMNGLDMIEAPNRRRIPMPIILISGHGDIPLAVRAIKAGAADFLEKPFRQQELLDRVNEAVAKNSQRHRILRERSEAVSRLSLLTRRERDVMNGLVTGESADEIGMRLGLSAKTVYTHRGKIFLKLRVDSIAALTRLALEVESDEPAPGRSAESADEFAKT